MDNFTFAILEEVYEKGKVPVEPDSNSSPLADRRYRSQLHLKTKGYVTWTQHDPTMRITIDGSAYVEERRRNNHLLELQEQNVDIQRSLRNCQRWLIVLTVITLLHTFGSFEWLLKITGFLKWISNY